MGSFGPYWIFELIQFLIYLILIEQFMLPNYFQESESIRYIVSRETLNLEVKKNKILF